MAQTITKKKIGEILLEAGILQQEHLDKALEKQKETGQRLGEVLVDLEFVKEEDLVIHLAVQFQVPYINLDNYEITQEILGLIPKGLAKKYSCLPMDKIGSMVSFVVSDPTNLYDLKQQESFLNCKMQFFVAMPSAVKAALKKHYGI